LLPLVVSLFYPAFAVAMVYAILRHRLFELRLVVRQRVRYAAARGLLLSLAPVMAVLLAADLWINRQKPLVITLSERAGWYGTLGICVVLLHWRRNTWMQALDRRFFRDQYDARELLHAIADEARRVRTLDQVASLVVSRIDTALHPEFAAIMVRQPEETAFRAAAAVRRAPAPIPADSCLAVLVRAVGRPLEISTNSDWLHRQLPPQEADLVCDEKLEWIFPIETGGDRPEALLLLGPKRSEEPYSNEDQTMLGAVAANLALLSL
jgi:hypothetical protein